MLDLTKFRRYISWLRYCCNRPDCGEGGFVMKSLMPFVIVFAFLFSSCTTTPNSLELTSSAIPTSSVTPVPSPSLTSTPEPTTTATATESPAPTQEFNLNADEMSIVVSSAEKNLADGFKLAKNLANTYSISRPDGTPVKNIVLKGDGKFYVTEADGSELAIDPLTVHMPSADKIYAELDQITISTDEVDSIKFSDTLWQTDKSPLITIDTITSHRYSDWVMNSSFGQDANTFFSSLDQNKLIKWQVVEDETFPVNIGNSQTAQFSGVALLPEGWKIYPNKMPPEDMPTKNTIPLFWQPGFVRLTGNNLNGTPYEGVSVTPEVIESNDLNTKGLFPLVAGTDQISAPPTTLYSLPLDLSSGKSDGIQYKAIPVPASQINAGSTSDGLFGTATLPYFRAGVNPAGDASRTKTLQDQTFPNSSGQLWPATTIAERQ